MRRTWNVTGASSGGYNPQMKSKEIQATFRYNDDVGDKKQKIVHLNTSTTIQYLETFVKDLLPEEHESMDLVLQCEDGKSVCLSENKTRCMGELGIEFNPQFNYTILIVAPSSEKLNMPLFVSDNEDDLLLGASASPTAGEVPSSTNNDMRLTIPENAPLEEAPLADYGYCSTCRVEPEPSNDESMSVVEACNYVGLVNQAMTCYLNSLVQALYMTPEFRNAIYNWEFDGQNEARSIPYQLQKLFLNLQTSPRSAVETTDLTTSFGWQGSEAWHQHDIQELCRVMFDALERKFKDTKQANLINDLYEGTMLDYVKCLECGTEKSREDTFLDIPLPVRPFGSAVAYNSVEEALRAFVQPETLEGNNQYFCEKCNKKCDAHKGLKFIKFPYLLTLHLKRFDFDYNTMHRIKLNDKVVFPEKLNLNSFVPNSRINEHLEERDIVVKCDDCSTTDSGSALDDESCQGTDLSSTVNDHDENCEDSDEGTVCVGENAHPGRWETNTACLVHFSCKSEWEISICSSGIDVSSGNHHHHHHENEAKGPFIYELFSILIHSGSASGGHYYAYIKDFDKNHWLCFNDQSVNRVTEEDIRKTYGGGPQKGYYSGVYSSSTNAYMLMYRQIDKNRNCMAMKVDQFPPHMQKLVVYLREKEKQDKMDKEKQSNSFKLTVHCHDPVTAKLLDLRLNVLSDTTLEGAINMAHQRFKLEGIVDVEDCRLVIYNKKQSCIDWSFHSNELKFCDIADKYTFFCPDWYLEIREPGTEFTVYKRGGINIKTYLVNVETEDVKEPVAVRVDVGDTVGVLKQNISSLLNIDASNMKLAIEKFYNDPQYLDGDDTVVPFNSSTSEYKLFLSDVLDEDPSKDFENSKLKKIIERFDVIVHLNILLPDTSPGTLENMFIPSLDSNHNGEKLDNCVSEPGLRVSPQPASCNLDAFGDQSNSEDSSLSDSDRTLVGDAPGESHGLFSSNSNSPVDQHMTSPSEVLNTTFVIEQPEMNWDDCASGTSKNTYFKVTSLADRKRCSGDGNYAKLCRVFVDNQMTLDAFKKCLEQVVRVPKEYFKIFKHHSGPEEEWSNLCDTLRNVRDGQALSVKLGRALSLDEFCCKVYLLRLESADPNHFLFEHILARRQSVKQAKREIIFRAKKEHMLDMSPNKCRLREKCLKNPKMIYLDEQHFVDDILVSSSSEIYLQELSEPERVLSAKQLVLFARHWCPSSLTLQPFQEVVLDKPLMAELKAKVSEMSNIPVDNIEVAFLRSAFPCDMNLLDIHSELEWNPNVLNLDQWPLEAQTGATFFYRDNRELLKELTPDEKKEISLKENTRLGRVPLKAYQTSWERSLRIYTDNWPSDVEDTID